mgnify:CR=1 FL=1
MIVIVTASTAGIDNYQNDEFCYLASSIKVSMVPFIGGEKILTLELFFERLQSFQNTELGQKNVLSQGIIQTHLGSISTVRRPLFHKKKLVKAKVIL